MFCTGCGQVLSDHARFCTKCGKPIHADVQASGVKESLQNVLSLAIYLKIRGLKRDYAILRLTSDQNGVIRIGDARYNEMVRTLIDVSGGPVNEIIG